MKKFYHTIVILVAISASVYVAVDAFYRVVRAELAAVRIEKTSALRPAVFSMPGQPPLAQYKIITLRNLFGSVKEPAQKQDKIPVEPIPPTSLKLELLGTVSGDPESTVAVIKEMDKNKEGLFRVGDTIKRATVKKILRGKVVLRVGDKDEILSMKESSSAKRQVKGRSAKVAGQKSQGTITVSRSEVEKSIQNLSTLLSQARVRPYFSDGKPNGLVLDHIKEGSFFSKLGLRNGDIVATINGKIIRRPGDIISAYKRLQSGSPISLGVSRRGKQVTLNYMFK